MCKKGILNKTGYILCKKISIVIYKNSMAYFPNAIQNTALAIMKSLTEIFFLRVEFAYNVSVFDVLVEEFISMLYII